MAKIISGQSDTALQHTRICIHNKGRSGKNNQLKENAVNMQSVGCVSAAYVCRPTRDELLADGNLEFVESSG